MEEKKERRQNPEAAQFYLVADPDMLDSTIGNFSFKARWWGVVPTQVWANDHHTHADIEIAYVYEGEGEMFLGERVIPLEKGTIVVAMPGDEHRLKSASGKTMGIYFVSYSSSLEAGAAGDGDITRLIRQFLACTERARKDGPEGDVGYLFETIRRSMEGRFPGWRGTAYSASRAMILTVARLFVPLGSPLPEPQKQGAWAWVNWSGQLARDESIVERVIALVLKRHREELRIEDAAKYTGINVRKLQRELEKRGFSFRTLLHDARLDQARHLLITTGLSVEEISEHVGFARLSYFSKMFKDKYGTSPLKYRSLRGQ